MKVLRQIGSVAFVLGLFTVLFVGIWHSRQAQLIVCLKPIPNTKHQTLNTKHKSILFYQLF
jgi:hypothetical protein